MKGRTERETYVVWAKHESERPWLWVRMLQEVGRKRDFLDGRESLMPEGGEGWSSCRQNFGGRTVLEKVNGKGRVAGAFDC